jgi:hypothetical protein
MFAWLRKLLGMKPKRKQLEEFRFYGPNGMSIRVNLEHPVVQRKLAHQFNKYRNFRIGNDGRVEYDKAEDETRDAIQIEINYHKNMIQKYHEGYDVDVEHHERFLENLKDQLSKL